ncbi:hypothetical protein PF005_g25470 [Phytophthora fragariae]|uniref:Uncharacterized protein n=1 Tax=Phytophthora fragariae TaxID=53985 RepID=A0A6A4DRL1_9STRA|nr:hypothetical protein PF003_g32987 [Phytophthora fragariae]KAE9077917.1 hypothetical protein PF010_g23327 [Phytophthora fragariae]KAE9175269.1 hypothetical protein PF005_g25470 [Phytophthora fragariae]KAE9181917.1 hypothetical protein PF004_g24394 [Phytophthora fragariae]KAE9185508.1 hypothetical protein PF002_g26148 [Phytophthora fragariae]
MPRSRSTFSAASAVSARSACRLTTLAPAGATPPLPCCSWPSPTSTPRYCCLRC